VVNQRVSDIANGFLDKLPDAVDTLRSLKGGEETILDSGHLDRSTTTATQDLSNTHINAWKSMFECLRLPPVGAKQNMKGPDLPVIKPLCLTERPIKYELRNQREF